ncbi:conserved hypothetical protein [Vibrio coralliirubri]|uniref:AAA family ATPase n=1 Tax=Vibrio coralliirubri TaxID=1516159 RepID=UPI000637609E|nr:AAA family ATPase [Vibrio coralliirubri]CDT53448.1 conserved hypothetical protein [Vibrio coralliirubri]
MTKNYDLSNFAIGLAGTHRTGKTSLAKELSLRTELPFAQTSTSNIFKEAGLKPNAKLSFDERLNIQWAILDGAIDVWSQHKAFVTDRTPIDMAAYAMMDYIPNKTTQMQSERMMQYVEACIKEANKRFSSLVLVPQGIPVVYEDYKGVMNPLYMNKHELLIRGLFVDPSTKLSCYTLDKKTIGFEERMDGLMRTILKSFRKAESIRDGKQSH